MRMMSKSIIFWLTVSAVVVAALGLNLDHLHDQNQLEGMSEEVDDPVGDLEWLRFLDQEQRSKRGRFNKSDPRSLFAAIYSNYPYAKRSSGNYLYNYLESDPLTQRIVNKRGLKSRLDPKNLFRSAYGFKK